MNSSAPSTAVAIDLTDLTAESSTDGPAHTVALATLGCARNDVDSEEMAARLETGGFRVVDDPQSAQTVVVNTCAFVAAAKKDSVDALLEAAALKDAGTTQAVVAVGCMAERYGAELAAAMPEADAVLGFDDYPDIAHRLRGLLAGEPHTPHVPSDRRTLLPISPTDRRSARAGSPAGRPAAQPGHGAATPEDALPPFGNAASGPDLPAGMAPASGPRVVRRRLGGGPAAPLKLASGCDRRCTFCAIPTFRGSFVSRRPLDILDEAGWLTTQGVRELFLVSENSTSYGKDLGDLRLLETLLPELVAVDGVRRVRVSYLQPAELRPGLVEVIAGTPGVADYFDLSFQHAAPAVLRRMRRFGDPQRFLALLEQIRAVSPQAGARSNVIVGFPGETEDDVATLCDFLAAARLDVVGVFGYSDEDGTEAAGLDGHHDDEEVSARVDHVGRLVEELTAQRAEDRIGDRVDVLVEAVHADGAGAEGRAACQGPDVDGCTTLAGLPGGVAIGDVVPATVVATSGVDLVAAVSRG